MNFLAFAVFLQATLGDAIDKSELKAARKAVEVVVAKDEERSAKALIGAMTRTRQRLRLLERELGNTQKALERYRAMPALTPTDQKERNDGIQSSKDRIDAIIRMMRDTEEIHEIVRGAFRSLQSRAAVAAVAGELETSALWLARCEMADALGIMPGEEAERRLRERLAREVDPLVIAAVFDALAGRGNLQEETVRAVAERAAHKCWTVQITAARALAASGAKEGVEPLIGALPGAEGRARNEINAALKALTKTDLFGDAEAWAEWWKANGEDFMGGRYNPKEPKRAPGVGRTVFFQVPVISRRVAFLIDRSRSMDQVSEKGGARKIELARAELKALLAELADGTRVNFIFFGEKAEVFCQSSRALDARTRRDAAEFMDRFEPAGPTNLQEALEKALALVGNPETGALREEGVDTLFILSDGEPTAGRITHTDLILRQFTRENRYLRAAVHTVSIGDAGTLLTKLAEQNDGTAKSR